MVYQINSQGLHLSGASRLQRNQSLCRSLAAFSISCPILLCFNLKLQCCASQQNWFLLRQERKKMLILGRWEGKRNRNIAFILKQSKTLQNLKNSFYPIPLLLWVFAIDFNGNIKRSLWFFFWCTVTSTESGAHQFPFSITFFLTVLLLCILNLNSGLFCMHSITYLCTFLQKSTFF